MSGWFFIVLRASTGGGGSVLGRAVCEMSVLSRAARQGGSQCEWEDGMRKETNIEYTPNTVFSTSSTRPSHLP
ncbi:hypothetical protein B0H19DRAFT_515507 [Mycena capillaripes]|nr:hypothetical protein B0H19DRAFT_515507 [Mycena capillaripes]